MPESQEHMDLVKLLSCYVQSILGENERNFVEIDCPTSTQKPSRVFNNCTPDLYYNWSGKMIIGEAKTEHDIDRKHSKFQYESYINACKSFVGDTLIVFAVPFYGYNTIKNLLRIIKSQIKYQGKIVVLDSEGRKCEV